MAKSFFKWQAPFISLSAKQHHNSFQQNKYYGNLTCNLHYIHENHHTSLFLESSLILRIFYFCMPYFIFIQKDLVECHQ